MSFASCQRKDCTNFLCDLFSNQYGYICRECFLDLIATGPTTDIADFMQSESKPDGLDGARIRYSKVFSD